MDENAVYFSRDVEISSHLGAQLGIIRFKTLKIRKKIPQSITDSSSIMPCGDDAWIELDRSNHMNRLPDGIGAAYTNDASGNFPKTPNLSCIFWCIGWKISVDDIRMEFVRDE